MEKIVKSLSLVFIVLKITVCVRGWDDEKMLFGRKMKNTCFFLFSYKALKASYLFFVIKVYRKKLALISEWLMISLQNGFLSVGFQVSGGTRHNRKSN